MLDMEHWVAIGGLATGLVTAVGGYVHGRRPYLKLHRALDLAQLMADGEVNSEARAAWTEHCSRLTYLAARRGERPSKLRAVLQLLLAASLIALGATLLAEVADTGTTVENRIGAALFGAVTVFAGGVMLLSVKSLGRAVSGEALRLRRSIANSKSEGVLKNYKDLIEKRNGYRKIDPRRLFLGVAVWSNGLDLTAEQAATLELEELERSRARGQEDNATADVDSEADE